MGKFANSFSSTKQKNHAKITKSANETINYSNTVTLCPMDIVIGYQELHKQLINLKK